MKIIVNSKQEKINFNNHLNAIIEMAKNKASLGISSFYYPIPIGQNIHALHLIDGVENRTENTVYGGYKCIKNGMIRFSIQTN